MRSNVGPGKNLMIAVIAVVLVFFVLVILVATIGGGLRSHEQAEIALTDLDIAAEARGIADATLTIMTYLDNSGEAKSGEIELLVKAYDTNTNLLITSNTTEVGVINAGETISATTYLTLTKRNDYTFEIVIFEDGEGVLRGKRSIAKLSRLEPPSVAQIAIREIDFYVDAVEVDREKNREYAVINTTLYVDNLGKDVSDLRTLIKARDNETRLITDRKWLDLGYLKEGTTSLRYGDLQVLNGRDYVFEVQVWQSERIIKESSGMVFLSPFVNRTVVIAAEEKTVEISPEVEITDFMSAPTAPPRAYPTPVPEEPGFEALSAAFASFIVFSLLLKRRKGGA